MTASAVVFAYHDIGCRCLATLIEAGVKVSLVVTHRDDPAENVWFGSVAEMARGAGIPVAMPDDPNAAPFVSRVSALNPDLLFSFYFRHMLNAALLAVPPRGAWNMHGSLLPRYRGRSPVNWAVLQGERETGMTLHRMVEKPDAGEIVGQEAVAIDDNDSAHDVFRRLTPAAGLVLSRALPTLVGDLTTWVNGSPPGALAQDLAAGSYFGGRKPEDGRIDWRWEAWRVHNLIRAVAPPFPAAFTHLDGQRVAINRSWWAPPPEALPAEGVAGALAIHAGTLYARCGDGRWLALLEAAISPGPALQGEALARVFAGAVQGMGQFAP